METKLVGLYTYLYIGRDNLCCMCETYEFVRGSKRINLCEGATPTSTKTTVRTVCVDECDFYNPPKRRSLSSPS
jgi:hypothetical protein